MTSINWRSIMTDVVRATRAFETVPTAAVEAMANQPLRIDEDKKI